MPDSTHPAIVRRAGLSRWLAIAFRATLALWAIGLITLHLLFAFAELDEHWQHFAVHASSAFAMLILCTGTWLWPRCGGAQLAAFGLFSFWLYHHPFAYTFVAAPAITLGMVGVFFRGFSYPKSRG